MADRFSPGKHPREMAAVLSRIFKQEFGGKKKGRFRTSRNNFRKLADIGIITDDYLKEVAAHLFVHDLLLINLDTAFCVFPINSCTSFRRVPETMIAKYLDADKKIEIEAIQGTGKQGLNKAWAQLEEMGQREKNAAVRYDAASRVYSLAFFDNKTFVSVKNREVYSRSPQIASLLNRAGQYCILPILCFLAEGKPVTPTGNYVTLSDLMPYKVASHKTEAIPLSAIAAVFGNNLPGFAAKGASFGGTPGSHGDASLVFEALPGVRLLMILRTGDDAFDARVDLLVDSGCSLNLPSDILWMVMMACTLAMLTDPET